MSDKDLLWFWCAGIDGALDGPHRMNVQSGVSR